MEASGIVTGADDGEPLPGAKVIEKGTSNGTLTDDNGNFKLSVAEGATLIFGYVGMETMEMAASPSMNVSMKPSIIMDKVVVTALSQSSLGKFDVVRNTAGNVRVRQVSWITSPSVCIL